MEIYRLGSTATMSASVTYNGIVYVSGQVATDYSDDIDAQTLQALNNIENILISAGSCREKLLTATVFLSDISEFDKMNHVWTKWFAGANLPTRATIESRLADPGMRIEIVVSAAT